MINPEAMQECKANPITIEFMALLEKEKQMLLEAMGNGHFLNLENMAESFGAAAKNVGIVEGLDKISELLEREEENE